MLANVLKKYRVEAQKKSTLSKNSKPEENSKNESPDKSKEIKEVKKEEKNKKEEQEIKEVELVLEPVKIDGYCFRTIKEDQSIDENEKAGTKDKKGAKKK